MEKYDHWGCGIENFVWNPNDASKWHAWTLNSNLCKNKRPPKSWCHGVGENWKMMTWLQNPNCYQLVPDDVQKCQREQKQFNKTEFELQWSKTSQKNKNVNLRSQTKQEWPAQYSVFDDWWLIITKIWNLLIEKLAKWKLLPNSNSKSFQMKNVAPTDAKDESKNERKK